MKKTVMTLAAAAVAAGSLFAVAPAASADTGVKTAASAKWSKKDLKFIKAVREEVPVVNSYPDGHLVKGAKKTCDALRAGASKSDLVGFASELGVKKATSNNLIDLATSYYCPKQA